MSWIGRKSPCNCTECMKFQGNLEFRSDTEKDLDLPFEEVIWIDCSLYGTRFCNNELLICEHFDFDPAKKSLVELDRSFSSRYFRVYRRAGQRVAQPSMEISNLERLIYDRVCEVSRIVEEGYDKQVCIIRTARDSGAERLTVAMKISEMLKEEIIFSDGKYLKPIGFIVSIEDALKIGKKKVVA